MKNSINKKVVFPAKTGWLKCIQMLFMLVAVFFASCKSSTTIVSHPSDAKLTVNGRSVGKTPYMYSDIKFSGATTHVLIEKEGYEPIMTYFKRNEKLDIGALVSGCCFVYPLLWLMKYKPQHDYELTPLNSVQRGEEVSLASVKRNEETPLKPVQRSEEVQKRGQVGDLVWVIANNTLTISGEGEIPDKEVVLTSGRKIYSISVTIGVGFWDSQGFNDTRGIKKIVIGDSITSIGSGVFFGHYEASTVRIPNSVTKIGKAAFANSGLISVNIPMGVKEIGKAAFFGCNLGSVTIPPSVTEIGQFSFSCKNLNNITVGWTNPPIVVANTFSTTMIPVLYIPAGTMRAYKYAGYEKCFKKIVEN